MKLKGRNTQKKGKVREHFSGRGQGRENSPNSLLVVILFFQPSQAEEDEHLLQFIKEISMETPQEDTKPLSVLGIPLAK